MMSARGVADSMTGSQVTGYGQELQRRVLN